MQAISRSIRRGKNNISKSPVTIIQGQPFWFWNWPSKFQKGNCLQNTTIMMRNLRFSFWTSQNPWPGTIMHFMQISFFKRQPVVQNCLLVVKDATSIAFLPLINCFLRWLDWLIWNWFLLTNFSIIWWY